MAKEELKLLKSKEESVEDSLSLKQFHQTRKVNANHTKRVRNHKRARPPNDTDEFQLSTLKRAEELQVTLDPQFPSLVKYMLPSHVSSCFWLGFPVDFCKSYLPKQDEIFTLINENGEEYPVKFLAEKTGLSGGWRGFSISHKLVAGDAVVFHLIRARKFKVYIMRVNELAEVDGALSLLELDAHGKQTDPDHRASKDIKTTKKCQRKRQRTLPVPIHQGNYTSTSPQVSGLDLVLPEEHIYHALPVAHSGNNSEEVDSDVNEGIKFSKSIVEFKDTKSLETSNIIVNGLIIDSEIPTYVKAKYHELCRSQNSVLHDHLPKVINCKLVAGIISETVNIADAIVASKLTTPRNEFTIWDKSLNAFEQLGMNVGFLRSRLQRLMNLASESEQAMDSKRYREALVGQSQVEEEIRSMESKLLKLRETSKRFGTKINTLKMREERREKKFRAEASARW